MPASRSFLVLPKTASRLSAVGAILKPNDPSSLFGPDVPLSTPATPIPSTGPFDFVLAVGGDERLLGRLNDLPGSVTVSTSGKNSDAKYKLAKEDSVSALGQLLA